MTNRKKSTKRRHKKREPASTANLQSPLRLPILATPTSTNSLTYSPSDLTPPVSALQNTSINSPDTNASRTAIAMMRPFGETIDYTQLASSSPTGPASDIHHAKIHHGTPQYSRTVAVKSFGRAFSAGNKLQQVLGFKAPGPFVAPPEMLKGMERAFVGSLGEYGLDLESRKQVTRVRDSKSELPRNNAHSDSSMLSTSGYGNTPQQSRHASKVLFPLPASKAIPRVLCSQTPASHLLALSRVATLLVCHPKTRPCS